MTKHETQTKREQEMRDRLGEWLEAAHAIPATEDHHLWFAGAISALRGLVVYHFSHFTEAVLCDIAKEVSTTLRSRFDLDAIRDQARRDRAAV